MHAIFASGGGWATQSKGLAPVAGRLSGQHHHSTRKTDAGVCLGANHGENKSIGYNSVVSVVNAE